MVSLADFMHSIDGKGLQVLLFFTQMSIILKLVEISRLSEKVLSVNGILLVLSYQVMRFQYIFIPF